jgi:hypothetical protein
MAKPKKKQQGETAALEKWVIVVAEAFEKPGVGVPLAQLYARLDGHPRTTVNLHWRDKVRQVLQRYACFEHVEKGVWALKPDFWKHGPRPKR